MFGMTTAALMWSMVFGSIGTGYFIYGKRQGEALWLIAGLLLAELWKTPLRARKSADQATPSSAT